MKTTILSSIFFTLMVNSAFAQDQAPVDTQNLEPSDIASAPIAPQSTSTQAIDCNYHIPLETKTIDQSLITNWATKAALQSFTFNAETVQNQLDALKNCYTEQGWTGFNNALKESGNIDSIKNQQLNVSSQLDGNTNINVEKENQWKVTFPIQVVYQNDKEKVTQKLLIGVLVGRKDNGDLGIMQLIATTREGDASTSTSTPVVDNQPKTTSTTTTSNQMNNNQEPMQAPVSTTTPKTIQ